MPKPRIAIIDAYSLLYRAFFALPPLTNRLGEVTNAVYGFTTMLFKLLDEEQPECVAVAFDMPAVTFRHEAYEAYKAHRPPMPEAMRSQVSMTREVLAAMRIPMLGVEGYEADDVIGTLARRAEQEGVDVLIVTADRDALQLVNDHVRVLTTRRGITDTVIFDRRAVVERYGVQPEQLPDMKALAGDQSDNIPGVPGIGEKTAGKLIAEYRSLEELQERGDEVPGKLGAALIAHAEQARQSKHLATIKADVPLEGFDWHECRRQPWDQERLLELFRRFDFHSLLGRLPVESLGVEREAREAPLAGIRVVESPEALAQVAQAAREAGHCALVAVAEGRNPLRDRLVGLALAAGDDVHAYVPLAEAPPAEGSLFGEDRGGGQRAERLRALAPLLEDADICKIGYNLKAVALWLRGEGISLRGLAFDLQIAAYVSDPTARHTFADVALDFLDMHVEVPDLTACWRAGDAAALAGAAGQVMQIIRRAEGPLRKRLADDELTPLFREVEMPLIEVLAEMEWRGVAIDIEHLEQLSAELEKSIHQLEHEVYQLAGEPFSINSPKQLQHILYDKLGLPRGRKTKTGFSTDADTLAALMDRHPVVQRILGYRELTKLKSTYVDSLPPLVNPRTGRIHTNFNQAVTATGRLSSSDPNLQNIPIRTPEGREIRQAFVPGEPGWLLLAADYSQIELRVLAHIACDEALTEFFHRGEDLHTATACRVFGVSPGQVTPEMRRAAKVVNFSIPYGTSAFGLAAQLGVSREAAEELMGTYLTRFPGVARYMEEIVQRARRDGYVTTLLGRRRPLPDLRAPAPTVRQAAERAAINTPIQGTAADIMKLAMLRLHRALRATSGLRARMLLQVHDEMVLEMPAEEVERVAAIVGEAMRGAYALVVPLEVEVKVGPNWRDVSPQIEEGAPLPADD